MCTRSFLRFVVGSTAWGGALGRSPIANGSRRGYQCVLHAEVLPLLWAQWFVNEIFPRSRARRRYMFNHDAILALRHVSPDRAASDSIWFGSAALASSYRQKTLAAVNIRLCIIPYVARSVLRRFTSSPQSRARRCRRGWEGQAERSLRRRRAMPQRRRLSLPLAKLSGPSPTPQTKGQHSLTRTCNCKDATDETQPRH